MKVSKIVFAQYDKDDKVKVGFSLPRNEDNIKITEPLIKSEKIKCSKDVIVSCEKCNEKQCNIFFNNYTGLFSYKNGGNIEQILVIHKKLCRLLNQSPNKEICKECVEISDRKIVDEIIEKYNQFFEKFALEIIHNLAEHLPFLIISPVSAYINEIDFTDNPILKLILIYQKRDEIRSSINHILSNPHRKIIEVSNLCRYDEVTYIDSDVILDILQNPHRLIADKNGCLNVLNTKYSPYQVIQYSIEESFDTLENRYIKALLSNLIEIIQECITYINQKFIKSEIKNEDLYKKYLRN